MAVDREREKCLLLQFCTWLYATPFGRAIRESTSAFPLIEALHTLGIMVLVGTIAVLDLRLLGLILRDALVSRLYRQVIPGRGEGSSECS
jgi:hypothetical protein